MLGAGHNGGLSARPEHGWCDRGSVEQEKSCRKLPSLQKSHLRFSATVYLQNPPQNSEAATEERSKAVESANTGTICFVKQQNSCTGVFAKQCLVVFVLRSRQLQPCVW